MRTSDIILLALILLGSSTSEASSTPALNYTPVDGKATCGARSLLTYLQKVYGTGYISGQQDAAALSWVTQNVGKTPALQGNDFIDYSPSRVANGATSHAVEDAQAHNSAGGINAFVWHWNAPTDLLNSASEPWYKGFYTAATSFNIQTALAEGPGGSDYKLILRDIDAIAVEIKRLSDSNIPILFRPLHEPDGGWFWWGAHGSAPFKQLWDVLYDRIVNYHGLHNMVWVCNTANTDWYPGNDKCDIATIDFYATTGDHSPQSQQYNILKSLTGDARVLTLAEVGEIPDPEQQHSQETPWAYWMTWTGDFISGGTDNTKAFLETVYNDKYVITLDGSNRLQGWECGSSSSLSSKPTLSSTLSRTKSGTSRSDHTVPTSTLSSTTTSITLRRTASRSSATRVTTSSTSTAVKSSTSDGGQGGGECGASGSDESTTVGKQPSNTPNKPASSSFNKHVSSTFVTISSKASRTLATRTPTVSPTSALKPATSHADQSGYILPFNGTASTAQFFLGGELSGGTSCGIDALPLGSAGSSPGSGPGFLYAGINQLAFGANPAGGAGGPGAACGICFKLTPISSTGAILTAQETTFLIVDECSISSSNCGQCSAMDVNSFGQTFHFNIAADAMNQQQYNNFFKGVTDGSDWKEVHFSQVGCTAAANKRPNTKSWGCIDDCKNNHAAMVCAS